MVEHMETYVENTSNCEKTLRAYLTTIVEQLTMNVITINMIGQFATKHPYGMNAQRLSFSTEMCNKSTAQSQMEWVKSP